MPAQGDKVSDESSIQDDIYTPVPGAGNPVLKPPSVWYR